MHSSLFAAPTSPTLQKIMSYGAIGVQLFFIVSAWTLYMSWKFRSMREKYPIRNFFIRRFFRIAPMFYFAILFYLILYGFLPRPTAPNGIEWWFVPLTVLFLNGFHPETISSVVPGGWPIAVEMNFYFILPFLFFKLKTSKATVLFFLFSIALYKISKIVFLHIFLGNYPVNQQYLVYAFTDLNFFSQLPVFTIGILAYFLFNNFNSLRRVLFSGYLCFILLIILRFLPHPYIIPREILLILRGLFNLFALTLFALTLASFPLKVLVNNVISQFGKISFSMYLIHFAVLYFFSKFGISKMFPKGDISSILHFLIVAVLTAALSYILYTTIERQGILLGKRVIDRFELDNHKNNHN